MRTHLRQRFGTIRWQLTWSYIWITVLISAVISTLFVVVFASTSLYPTASLLGQTSLRYAEDLRPAFAARPLDAQKIATALRYKFGTARPPAREDWIAQGNASATMQPDLTVRDQDFHGAPARPLAESLLILALDPQGRIIAGTYPDLLRPGQPWSDPAAPGAAPAVAAALRGETALEQITSRVDGSSMVAAAAPILDEQGAVRGVLYLRTARGLGDNPTWLRYVLALLLISVLGTFLTNSLVGLLFGALAARPYSRRLKHLTTVTAAFASGDLSSRVSDGSADEIGMLGSQFNTMADQLEASVRSLRQLADRNAALAEQAAQLATVEERNRLARDLHDSVSQELFSVTMLAAAVRNLLATNPVKASAQLEQLGQMAQHALHETRALIFALRPAALGDQGLAPALRQLAQEAVARQGLQIDLRIAGERRIPLEQEQALFRIAQEGLANVAKHSGVQQAALELDYGADHTRLVIRDSGHGFDPQQPRRAHSLGLISISERIAAIGGALTIDAAPGRGTTLTVRVPK